jgi:hypothetical protein
LASPIAVWIAFGTGRGCQNPADAVVRLADIASKNRPIDLDRAAYQRVRRDARLRDVTGDISDLPLRLTSATRVREGMHHVEGRTF